MTNRHEIFLNLQETLEELEGEFDLRTFIPEFREFDAIGTQEFNALCYFPAPDGSPTPRYEFGNSVEKFVDFIIMAHVRAGDAFERSELVNEIEELVRSALMEDPSRGGWAVDTIQVDDSLNDIGAPLKGGVKGATATGQWRYRCNFFPND